ncbi:MAG TPA: hypothetical protein VF508_02450 [Pyrinomonadaceae bacterium]|jgi:hypothetical protein
MEQTTKRVRIIKGGRAAQQQQAEAARATAAEPQAPTRHARDVVSDWVRDHRQRADEFRRNYSTLLGEMGFKTPDCCGRAA